MTELQVTEMVLMGYLSVAMVVAIKGTTGGVMLVIESILWLPVAVGCLALVVMDAAKARR